MVFIKKIVLCLIVLLFVCGCSNNSLEEIRKVSSITADSVFTMMNRENVYIVDVREEYEYNSGHIENAYNIPVSEINKIRKNEIPLDGIVVVYCQSGNRSSQAGQILLDLGYKNVYDMGGVNLWEYGLITE